MSFFERLEQQTADERAWMFSAPIVARCFRGDVTVEDYGGFLLQAWHHVRHTVPLLMAAGARLRDDQAWLRGPIAGYIAEEAGHDEWILDDLVACGYDRAELQRSVPGFAVEVMVAYARDLIAHRNAAGFFGMVYVLEGTSVSTATLAAAAIQRALGLGDGAFHYLTSHGAIDIEHIAFFRGLMDRVTCSADQDAIVHAARRFYRLYGGILHDHAPLPLPLPLPTAPRAEFA